MDSAINYISTTEHLRQLGQVPACMFMNSSSCLQTGEFLFLNLEGAVPCATPLTMSLHF